MGMKTLLVDDRYKEIKIVDKLADSWGSAQLLAQIQLWKTDNVALMIPCKLGRNRGRSLCMQTSTIDHKVNQTAHDR